MQQSGQSAFESRNGSTPAVFGNAWDHPFHGFQSASANVCLSVVRCWSTVEHQ